MPDDFSIPLQAGQNLPQFGPNWGVVQNALKTQIAIQQQRDIQDAQNALRAAYGNPSNLEPGTSQLTPGALNALMARSPNAGIDAFKINNALAQQSNLSAFRNSELIQRWVKQSNEGTEGIYGEYKAELAKGTDQKTAQDNAQAKYSQMIQGFRQAGMPANIAQMIPPNFDPGRIEGRIQLKQMEKAHPQIIQDKDPTTGAVRNVVVTPGGSAQPTTLSGQPTVVSGEPPTKPSEVKPFKIETTDGKPRDAYRSTAGKIRDYLTDEEIDPKDIKPGSMRNESPRTAATPEQAYATALAIYEYRQPPLSSYAMSRGEGQAVMEALKEIEAERGRKYDAKNYGPAKVLMEGYARTTPNSPGGQINSVNTAVQHLDQLKALSAALKNRDQPAANAVLNYVQTQLGHPEVTNFNIGAQIISDEVLKSVIGAGAVFDRAGLQAQLTNTKSPAQIDGGIKTIEGLMGGRLNSMRKQWTGLGLPEDQWESKLTDEAREAIGPYMGGGGKKPTEGAEATAKVPPKDEAASSGVAEPKSQAEYDKLPSGSQYLYQGKIMVKP